MVGSPKFMVHREQNYSWEQNYKDIKTGKKSWKPEPKWLPSYCSILKLTSGNWGFYSQGYRLKSSLSCVNKDDSNPALQRWSPADRSTLAVLCRRGGKCPVCCPQPGFAPRLGPGLGHKGTLASAPCQPHPHPRTGKVPEKPSGLQQTGGAGIAVQLDPGLMSCENLSVMGAGLLKMVIAVGRIGFVQWHGMAWH